MRLIYVDEVRLHQDLALGYRWSAIGEADWVVSHCPRLKNRLNWYGAYDFSHGQCLIWQQESCDSVSNVAFLQYVALKWPADPTQQTVILWDGAAWHSRADIVRDAAKKLGFMLIQLPAYSPDLNPIEGLWKWMREELTQHYIIATNTSINWNGLALSLWTARINLDPEAIITRLWSKFELDPDYEKVLLLF